MCECGREISREIQESLKKAGAAWQTDEFISGNFTILGMSIGEVDRALKERDEAIQRATRAEAKLAAKELNGTLRGYDGMAEELAAAIERAERLQTELDKLKCRVEELEK